MDAHVHAHLLVDLTEDYNDVRLPGGSFSTSLLGLRGTWNFSRSLLLTGFAQANTGHLLVDLPFHGIEKHVGRHHGFSLRGEPTFLLRKQSAHVQAFLAAFLTAFLPVFFATFLAMARW